MHELVPDVPLRHGHAISIDMAYSATLANMHGLVSDSDHKRILSLFSRAGLSIDHPQFDEDILDKATKAILKTRDGKLRAAMPSPLGQCQFMNDVTQEQLVAALHRHKQIVKQYPRNGAGIEAFVDASDTGYTTNKKPVETNGKHVSNGKSNVLSDDSKVLENGKVNGVMNGTSNGTNGASNGTNGASTGTNGASKIATNDVKASLLQASGPKAVNGTQNGSWGIDHHTNGD